MEKWIVEHKVRLGRFASNLRKKNLTLSEPEKVFVLRHAEYSTIEDVLFYRQQLNQMRRFNLATRKRKS